MHDFLPSRYPIITMWFSDCVVKDLWILQMARFAWRIPVVGDVKTPNALCEGPALPSLSLGWSYSEQTFDQDGTGGAYQYAYDPRPLSLS